MAGNRPQAVDNHASAAPAARFAGPAVKAWRGVVQGREMDLGTQPGV